ncbi:DedA family protein [Glacieibacterium frigidum]|uniref:DedA family protein n=1 Tax=Glacieibacterium frigidum TaxID=2593303 RepID=A0A552UF11_9SPHN|nr:DedA family protein [Glacieibacterium frigidum]TRW16759.1 DedA family protein [Glacieibacterium frigidum]
MNWIGEVIEQGGIAGIFALTLVETVFPPIPSEVVMPMAGIAAAKGHVSLAGAIIAGLAGSMAGNILLFVVARQLGAARFEAWVDRHGRWLTLDTATLERVRRWFTKHGGWAVGLGRCMPGIRSIISIPAGLIDMPWSRFLLWSTLGTTVWVAVLTGAGYGLGSAGLPLVERWLGPVSNAIIVIAAATYVIRLLTWKRAA